MWSNRLINATIDFCRLKGYKWFYLWTFEGLKIARHLYEKAGFTLVEQYQGTQWGAKVTEQ
jgi:GNAT superfamily N-acetyltransferase